MGRWQDAEPVVLKKSEKKTVWDLLIWWLGPFWTFCLRSCMVNLGISRLRFFRDSIKPLQPLGNYSQFDLRIFFQMGASTTNYCCRLFPIFLWLPWILRGRVSVPGRVFWWVSSSMCWRHLLPHVQLWAEKFDMIYPTKITCTKKHPK